MKFAIRKAVLLSTVAGTMFNLGTTAAFAQTSSQPDAQGAEQESEQIDQTPTAEDDNVILVRGIRGSLADALQTKREATGIVDAISAEDIGKLPDNNVAEALQRVTGVQITRNFGEGSGVQIRGLGANRTEINGRSFLGSTGGRQANLLEVPSTLVSGIEVIKSPTAKQIEGSLGGTIRLKTRRPFDTNGQVVGLSAEGIYEEKAKKWGPNLSALYSWSGDTDIGRIGFLINGAYSVTHIREDQIEPQAWTQANLDADGDGVREQVFVPSRWVRLFGRDVERERVSLDAAVQLSPSDFFEITVDGSVAKFFETLRSPLLNSISNPNQFVPGSGTVSPNGTVLSGRFRNTNLRAGSAAGLTERDRLNYNTGIKMDYDDDKVFVGGEISYSRGEADGANAQLNLNLANASGFYDLSDPQNPIIRFDQDITNLASYTVFQLVDSRDAQRSDELALRLDGSYRFDSGLLQKLSAGMRYADYRTTNETIQAIFQNFGGRSGATAADAFDLNAIAKSGFLKELGSGLPSSFPVNIKFKDISELQAIVGNPQYTPALDVPSAFDVNEKTMAAYFMADLEGDFVGLPFQFNAGVRYITTDLRSAGLAQAAGIASPVPVVFKSSYDEWLPSAHLKVKLRPDLFLRASAARTLARPATNDIAPNLVLNRSNFTGRAGNPGLEPLITNGADLGIEWYIDDVSFIGATLFYKDVRAFLESETRTVAFPNIEPTRPNFDITTPVNGDDGTAKGIELQVQKTLNELPSPLDGLGFILNYTYVDSAQPFNDPDGNPLELTGLSKHSANLIGFYEKGPISARLAYNWRDDYLINRSGQGGRAFYARAFGQLDFSASFDVTKSISVNFDAINLTKSSTYEFQDNLKERWTLQEFNGRKFLVGARALF